MDNWTRIVWITGASSGIGNALVQKFLKNNHTVIASSRTDNNLQKYATNKNFCFLPVDITIESDVATCCNTIKQRFGKIDIAILNAGICEYIDIPNFDVIAFKRNFDVNVFGIFICIKHCMPLLEKSEKPQLAGVSSSAAYLPFPRAEGYGASKAASLYLLYALQSHLKYTKISVNVICPGFVKTPLTDKNDFKMPFLVDIKSAANYIFLGIMRNKHTIEFPFRLVLVLRLLAALPRSLQNYILAMTIKRR